MNALVQESAMNNAGDRVEFDIVPVGSWFKYFGHTYLKTYYFEAWCHQKQKALRFRPNGVYFGTKAKVLLLDQ